MAWVGKKGTRVLGSLARVKVIVNFQCFVRRRGSYTDYVPRALPMPTPRALEVLVWENYSFVDL